MSHISAQFDRDLEKLRDSLLLMGGSLETMLKDVRAGIVEGKEDLVEKIVKRDVEIDQMEKKVDELAMQIMATRQPAAQDLRFVLSATKICTDLERMGDLITNMGERYLELCALVKREGSSHHRLKAEPDLIAMIDSAIRILSHALDAFVRQSIEIASKTLEEDRQMDQSFRKLWRESLTIIKADPLKLESELKWMFMGKHLERLSDHAMNIVEQVIFTVKGLDIRHSGVPGATP